VNHDQTLVFVIAYALVCVALIAAALTKFALWAFNYKHCRYKHRFALQDMRRTSDDPDSPERITWPCYVCGKEFNANCGLDIYKHGTADNSKGQS